MAAPAPRIRKAAASDAAPVLALIRGAYAKYVPRIGREPAPMTDDYAAEIAAGRCWVIEHGAKLSGAIVMRPKDGDWFVDTVGVAPEQQGRGVGKALMTFAEAEARRNGFAAVRLYTNARMTENFPFYQGLGYAITGRKMQDGFDRVFFLKRLEK